MKKYRSIFSYKFLIYLGCVVPLLFVLSGCGAIMKEDSEQTDTCAACRLYQFFFELIGEVCEKFFDKSREMALDLLALGTLLYLASVAYKLSAGFMGQGDRDVLKLKDDLYKTLFKVMMVALLLSTKDMFLSVIDFVVVPVLQAFIGVSKGVLATAFKVPSTTGSINQDLTGFSAIFSDEIGQPIRDLIYNVWQTLKQERIVAWKAAVSFNASNSVMGAFVFGLFVFMSIFVPFLFIDAFFRLGFLLIVSPLVLICIPFQATKKTTRAAWDILFGSMIQILIACIFISLMIIILKDYMPYVQVPSGSDVDFVNSLGKLQLVIPPATSSSDLPATPLQAFLLIYCLSKMIKNVPVLARYFGGDGTTGSVNQIGQALRAGVGSVLGTVAYPGASLPGAVMETGKKMAGGIANLTTGE